MNGGVKDLKLVTLSITQSSADTTAAVSIDGEFRLINEGGTITHLNYNNTSTNYIRGNQLYIDNATSGSCDVIITGSVTGSAFTGSFVGDGSGLTNLPSLNPYTVASLPAGTVGDRAYVTDATSPTYLGTLTGGGTITCPVFYNGSAWVSA